MILHLRGVYAPIVTPFDGDGIDVAGLVSNLERYSRTGLAGVVVLGSNSEAPLLDDEESAQVVETARRVVRLPQLLIAGTGRESTRATIQATRRAASAGADAVLVRTPSFFRAHMSADHYVAHYEAVADASPVPVLLYNVSVFTGVTLPIDAFARLAAHPNIIGIKESGPDLEVLAQYIAHAPAGFAVLGGAHATLYPAVCIGARGGVLAAAGVIPELCATLFDHAASGRHDEALALQRRIDPFCELAASRFGVAGLKAAAAVAGYAAGPPRPPLLPASADTLALIRHEYEALQAST
jgi:dihydrodipicolinate synthase/N-acetylneuraminate lyase